MGVEVGLPVKGKPHEVKAIVGCDHVASQLQMRITRTKGVVAPAPGCGGNERAGPVVSLEDLRNHRLFTFEPSGLGAGPSSLSEMRPRSRRIDIRSTIFFKP